jgi:hypothetical protein
METTFDLYSDVFKYTWEYRVVEVPVLLKARFPLRLLGTSGRGKAEASLYAGPAAMYLLDPPPKLEVNYNYGGDVEGDFGTAGDYRRLAWAAVGGLDFRHYSGRLMIGLDARFNWNFTSFDDYGAPFKDDTRVPGGRVSVQLGVRS